MTPQRASNVRQGIHRIRWSSLVLIGIVIAMTSSINQRALLGQEGALPEEWVNQFEWRSIGPANMSGRITSVAVYEADPVIWWAATASGGLLKTVNNGNTFEHQFDDQQVVSVGDVQVFQGDPNIVWVGTGEANPRNSVSWGNGVYKSTDGGETWTHLGLDGTFQTGRIALHPTDPDIAYVGSLGRLWGPNEERGLYKTVDGGESWEKILYVDDKTGVIDVQMHPTDPNTLLVATYERKRDGFDGNDPEVKYGEGSGIYRTTDGGESFTRLTNGLPTVKMGRVGISWYRNQPSTIYAIIETEKIGQEPDDVAYMGIQGEDADVGARLTNVVEGSPAAEAGLQSDDIVLSVDGVMIYSYSELTDILSEKAVGDTLALGISRDRMGQDIEVTLGTRQPQEGGQRGGRGQRSRFTGTLGGQAANLQNQQGKNGFEYGGIYKTEDMGESWVRINTLNPRPMYYSQLRVDPSDDQYMYVLGTSLWKSSDGGETFTGDGGSDGIHVDHHAMWIDANDGRHMILGNDGGVHVTHDRMTHWDHLAHVAIGQFYHVGVDATRNYRVYGGLQDNGSWGGPSRVRDGRGPVNSDWFRVGGGDGFICLVDPEDPNVIYSESQNGAMGRINLVTGERGFIRPRAPSGTRYRFNWKTPFILSPHNSQIHYSAGNHVFRSISRGDGVRAISPEITNTDRGAGSAISESAVEEGVIYVGTTDGALWMTRDGGENWVNLYELPSDDSDESDSAQDESDDNSVIQISSQLIVDQYDRYFETTTSPGVQEETAQEQQQQQGRGGRGGGGNAQEFIERIMEYDENKDGKITRDEAPEQLGRLIDRLDANDDDALDAEELAAMAQGGLRGGGQRGGGQRGGGQRGGGQRGGRPPMNQDDEAQDEEASEPNEAIQNEASEVVLEDDPVTGTYDGQFISENLPPNAGGFSFVLSMNSTGKITGTFESQMGEGEATGQYDAEKKTVTISVDNGQATLVFTATVNEGKLAGDIDINDGAFSVGFEATRVGDAPRGQEEDETEEAEEPGMTFGDLVPGPRWVSSLEASKHEAGRCYVTLDGHRSNDDEPYVLATENYGETWRSIRANLPTEAGSTRVIREDIVNPNLLYLGCEFSTWVSIDRGESWTRLNNNLPTVSIHEIAIHPTAGEIVAATHGRSLWILDVSTLRQITKESMEADSYLYRPADAIRWRSMPATGASSTRRFVGTNPDSGTKICYSLGKDADSVSLVVTDVSGAVVAELEAGNGEGLHCVAWDLRRTAQASQSGGPRGGARGGGGRGFRGRGSVSTGTYLVKLTVDGQESTQVLQVETDPDYPEAAAVEDAALLLELLSGDGLNEEEGEGRDRNQAIDRR